MEMLAPMAARFRLDYWLTRSGLSQRELAARSGVSATIVNRMANNDANTVALKTLDRLAGTLAEVLAAKGERVEVLPGDLIERVPEVKPKRRRKA
jgi:DNA-binding Xre family transcriptional regulator